MGIGRRPAEDSQKPSLATPHSTRWSGTRCSHLRTAGRDLASRGAVSKLTAPRDELGPRSTGTGTMGASCRHMRLNFKRLGLLSGRAARACARLGELTSARADLLALLLRGEHVQVELAAILCVTAPVVSRMLQALEARGLVTRRRHPIDRRYKICSLTAEGLARARACLDEVGGDAADGSWSAQCLGEHAWTRDWRKPLLRHGLQLSSIVEQGVVDLSLFLRMQHWNRALDYDGAFGGRCDHPPPLP